MDIGSRNEIRHFKTLEEVTKWTFKHIPMILETDKIPEDVIYPKGSSYFYPEKYYDMFEEYFRYYIKCDEIFDFDDVGRKMYNMLINAGFPKNTKEKYLGETLKFERNRDPKEAMNIGIRTMANKITTKWLDIYYHVNLKGPFQYSGPIKVIIKSTFSFLEKYTIIGQSFYWEDGYKMKNYILEFVKSHPEYKYVYDACETSEKWIVIFSKIELPNAASIPYDE